MAITRLAVSNPSADTDTLIHTASRSSIASVIATNKGTVGAEISVWVIPSGQDAAPENWVHIASNVPMDAGNTMETFRFPVVTSDKIYINASTANVSFSLNSLYEANGRANITVQADAPTGAAVGDIWVDSDDNQVYVYDGSSFIDITGDTFPSQAGNSGKYLTTDGSTTSWATIDLSGYATTTALSNHESDTTSVHGISDTSVLATNLSVSATIEDEQLLYIVGAL